MKTVILVFSFLVATQNVFSCETENISEEKYLSGSPAVKRLLKKASARLDAECSFSYRNLVMTRSAPVPGRLSGRYIPATFEGSYFCKKMDSTTIEKKLYGNSLFRYYIHRGDDECDGEELMELTKLVVKSKFVKKN